LPYYPPQTSQTAGTLGEIWAKFIKMKGLQNFLNVLCFVKRDQMDITHLVIIGEIHTQKILVDDYIKRNENYLIESMKSLKKEMNDNFDQLNISDIAKFDDNNLLKIINNISDFKINTFIQNRVEIAGEYEKIKKNFLVIFRESLIVFLYSNLEHYLQNICNYFQDMKKINVSYIDIQGKGIFQTIYFLKLLCNINLKETKEWEEVNYFNKIRNAIVHKNGLIKEEEIKKSIFYQNKMIQLNTTESIKENKKKIQVNEGALEYFNDLTYNFVSNTFSKLEK
jgi:hypothetical protein